MKKISVKLTKAVAQFETNYKNTLNQANLEDELFDTLYDLGADIKHLFDEIIDIIEEN